jgi:pyruvate kinase
MILPDHKTKIVATIGPASNSPEILERLIRSGTNIARLNFSHGNFDQHAQNIARIRAASSATNRRVAIMADLPGPKMRLGTLDPDPIHLEPGDTFTLTSEDIIGSGHRASMSFEPLPRVVKPGDRLFLNDGLVQLLVTRVEGKEVHSTVAVGGELRSRKGLNLPRISLGISAFTNNDRKCLEFALAQGVDAISQSFVESSADIQAARAAAASLGKNLFVIAKIERYEAIARFDEILAAADGIMVARGDLGVEVPIEEMAILQKRLIAKANLAGKPVITATQMLESMTWSRLPTRAEATDVANAILDGTDCVMLSGESATGRFPEESVTMLAKIAAFTEIHRGQTTLDVRRTMSDILINPKTMLVDRALELAPSDAVLVPTVDGSTARAVARWRPPVWIIAAGPDPATMQSLAFSYGVHPVDLEEEPGDWRGYAERLLPELGLPCKQVLLVAGPSPQNPGANQRLELMVFGETASRPKG